MKKLISIFLTSAMALVLLQSCSKSDDADSNPTPTPTPTPTPVVTPNSFTLTGDGYTDKKFEITSPSTAEVYHKSSNNNNYVKVIGMIGEDSVFMYFNMAGGPAANTYPWGGFTGGTIFITPKNGEEKAYSTKAGTGTFVITEYGAVGKKVKGTFSGTFVNPFTSVSVEIKAGNFEVTRTADQ